MKKSAIIISLALILTMIISCFTGWSTYSVSAAENETKVYFEVPTLESWGTTKSVYCHIYNVYGGTPLKNTSFQSKAEPCKKDAKTGLYYFDTANLGTIEEGADYALVFSTKDTDGQSHQTCSITFGKECLGDTVYVTGGMIENAEDSSKSEFEGAWKNNSDKFGAMVFITSTGKIVGKNFPIHQPREQIVAQFLASWVAQNSDILTGEIISGICAELKVNPADVLEQYKTDYAEQLADPDNNPSIAPVETVAALLGVDSHPITSVFVVAGVSELCGGYWDGNPDTSPDNIMVAQADGTYKKVYTSVAVMNDYQLKIVENTAEDSQNWIGIGIDANDNFSFNVKSVCDVTITFDPATNKITVTGTGVEQHDHDFTGDWEKDGIYHWHKCQNESCTEIKDQAEHSGGEATCTSKAICKYCDGEYGEVDSSNHNIEKISAKDATVTENGNKEYWHCKDCGKYFADENGTKEIKLVDTVITVNAWAKTVLRLQATASRTSIKLKWNAVPEADGYVIYWNKCGIKNAFKQVKVIKSGKILTWTHTKLKKTSQNKYYVKAYKVINGKKSFIKTSNRIHLVTKGGKYTNVKKLKSSVSSVTLKKGKTKTLKIIQTYAEKNKKPTFHMRPLTYSTSNKKVAAVTSKGVIKAKGKGSCYIYITAYSGAYTRVKVKVK